MEFLFKLKWLNGPLVGRELNLPEGDTRIGGEDPDIALSLEQGVSTILTVTREGITLAPAIPVWVDGVPWDTAQSLPLESAIDMAGQGMILGLPETALPALTMPTRVEPEMTRKKNKSWLLWTGMAAAVMMVAIGIASWFSFFSPAPQPVFDVHSWLNETLKSPDYSGLSAHIDDHGRVILSGLNSSSKNIMHLRQQLNQHHLPIHDESMGVDTLHLMVYQILTLHGYHDVTVENGDTLDSVNIYGNIRSDANWHSTNKQLHDIHQLKNWRIINDQAELFQSLFDLLQQRNLLEGLSITIVGKEIMVNGQLTAEREAQVTDLISHFNVEKKPRLRARFSNIPTLTSYTDILPATVMSVGGNARSAWIQLENGMRLQQGAVLPGNYKIFSLNHKTISFTREQQLISIPLNF